MENNNSESNEYVTGADKTGENTNERTFTQKDVDSIIKSRLDQMKRQAAKETETEYSARLADLEKREVQLTVREKLGSRGMPKELADVISCNNVNEIDKKLDILERLIPKADATQPKPGFVKVGAPQPKTRYGKSEDPYREAMGLKD